MNFKNMRDAVLRFATVLLKIGPDRQKRLSCLASLGAFISGTDKLDKSTISRLNQVMALGTEEGALTLPVYLNKVIWNDVGQEIDIDPNSPVDSPAFIDQIMKAMPVWLRYGAEETMRQDIGHLISSRREVFGS